VQGRRQDRMLAKTLFYKRSNQKMVTALFLRVCCERYCDSAVGMAQAGLCYMFWRRCESFPMTTYVLVMAAGMPMVMILPYFDILFLLFSFHLLFCSVPSNDKIPSLPGMTEITR